MATPITTDSAGNPISGNTAGSAAFTTLGPNGQPLSQNTAPTNPTPQVIGAGNAGQGLSPAPIVVNSSQAETALQGAANNVQNYNTANANPPTQTQVGPNAPSSITPPTSSSSPTATTPQSQNPGVATGQQVYSYTDPTTKTTSYYDQNGDPIQNFNPNQQGVTVTPLNTSPSNPGIPNGPGGYNPGASTDLNGNIIGTNIAAAYATGTEADVANLNAQLSANSQQIASIGAQTYQTLQNLLNGTIPFTPAQQSLITATQSQFQALIGIQQTSNAGLVGTAQESQARNGRYTPVNAMANVQAAVSIGNLALASIQAQQATSIAQMQQGFQEQNYNDVLSANNAYESSLKDANSVLENISTTIQNSIQTARQFNYQVTQDNISNILNNSKFTYQQKQDAITNALAQSTLDEKTKNDLIQDSIQQEIANNGRYEVTQNPLSGMQEIFDKQSGTIVGGSPTGTVQGGVYSGVDAQGNTVQPGATGMPLMDENTKTTLTGVPYVDGTNLSGTEAQAVQFEAASLGIPYMGQAQAAALNHITDARNNLNQITSSLAPLLAQSGLNVNTRLGNLFQASTQVGPNAANLASLNTWRSAAIGALQSLAGGSGSGLRISQSEITMSIQNDLPAVTDTVAVAQAKLAKLNQMLNNQEGSIFGSNYQKMVAEGQPNPVQAYMQTSSSSAQAMAKLIQEYPNATQAQLMQLAP